MRVAHIGPRLARHGGPSGYLKQLAAAAAADPRSRHTVTFPAEADPRPASTPPPRIRDLWTRVRRAVGAPPAFHRPSDADLRAHPGAVDAMMREAVRGVLHDTRETLESDARREADVLFAHEPAVAEALLATRGRAQQVWVMVHSPMPLALYLAWNWGVPERDWREVNALADVRAWTEWELDIWTRVDRVIVPCAEAIDELARIDPRARGSIQGRVSFVLTGASGGPGAAVPRAAARRRFGLPIDRPVALYLGNRQPYRGLDTLAESARLAAGSGLVAIAGPARDQVPRRPGLRALGPVSDVRTLFEAADVLVNVNRFSLFDLSTIEAAEAGKPLLLHDVGGNRTFRDLGCGTEMIADLDPRTIAEALERIFATPRERLAGLGARSRACYEQHLTPARCWARHVALYDEAAVRATPALVS